MINPKGHHSIPADMGFKSCPENADYIKSVGGTVASKSDKKNGKVQVKSYYRKAHDYEEGLDQ